jgi:hypothetical protein
MNKPKLELDVNKPVNIKLLQDKAVSGSNSFGNWFLFAVEKDNEQFSFFAPEKVNKFIQEKNLRKGDEIQIMKIITKNGKKNQTDFVMEVINHANGNGQHKPQGNGNGALQKQTNGNGSLTNDYDLMHESLSDARKLHSEFGALVDFSKVAISLFISKKKKNGNGYINE